jgi:hypothetical protein
VHLVRFQSVDECYVCLPTGRDSVLQNNHEINMLTDHTDDQETLNFVGIKTETRAPFLCLFLKGGQTDFSRRNQFEIS